MTKIETTYDGNILIHIPMCLRTFSGHKRIIIPEGEFSPMHNPTGDDRDRVVLLAFARAHHWKKMIDSGECKSTFEIAAKLSTDAGYIRKLMRLNDVSPRIVRRFLNGTQPENLTLNKLIDKLPYSWEEQEQKFLGC